MTSEPKLKRSQWFWNQRSRPLLENQAGKFQKRINYEPTRLTVSTSSVLNNEIGLVKHIPHGSWSQNTNFKYKNYVKSLYFVNFRAIWTFKDNWKKWNILISSTRLTASRLALLIIAEGLIKHIPHESWSPDTNFEYWNFVKSPYFVNFRANWTF